MGRLDGGVRNDSIPWSDKALGDASPYWNAAHDLASSFLGRDAVPGHDYALTEIVRCKSPKELGVASAAAQCVPTYLKDTLALSPAPLVAVLGRHARQVVRKLTGFAEYGPLTPPHHIGGRDRVFAFLGHPAMGKGAQVPQDARLGLTLPGAPAAVEVTPARLARRSIRSAGCSAAGSSAARVIEIPRCAGGSAA